MVSESIWFNYCESHSQFYFTSLDSNVTVLEATEEKQRAMRARKHRVFMANKILTYKIGIKYNR